MNILYFNSNFRFSKFNSNVKVIEKLIYFYINQKSFAKNNTCLITVNVSEYSFRTTSLESYFHLDILYNIRYFRYIHLHIFIRIITIPLNTTTRQTSFQNTFFKTRHF